MVREGFPWATFIENVSGGFLLGVLMVFLLDVWLPHRYLRPFLGVGVLGGYTTFSTYMLESRDLLAGGRAATAFAYLAGLSWPACSPCGSASCSPAWAPRGGGAVTIAMVLLGGAIGAPLRYLIDLFVQSRHDTRFPWGTFTVNVLGSLVLGAVAAAVVEAGAPVVGAPWSAPGSAVR